MPTITSSGQRAAAPREKRAYALLKDTHIPDARGRSQFYAAAGEGGEPTIVHLYPEDAKYWLMDGVIRPYETVAEVGSERTQSAKRRRA
jgi:hypothetical protein